MELQKPMNCDNVNLVFPNYHWRPRFSYGFDMASTCHQPCHPSKLTKFKKNQKTIHISNRFSHLSDDTMRYSFEET